MKLIELHILQTVPVSCLNRDDLNSPKSAVFGGVNRARVSSQSWKRAIRLYAKENLPESFGGFRTMLVKEEIEKNISKIGKDPSHYQPRILEAIKALTKKDKVDAIMFLSKQEIQMLSDAVIGQSNSENLDDFSLSATDDVKPQLSDADVLKNIKEVAKNIIKFGVSDLGDIAIFGRMSASNIDLNVESAGMFSHAISTHKVDNDIDFFTAVDELKTDGAGAGHLGSAEFNSATYYRYIALNVDQLKSTMKEAVTDDKLKEIIKEFIKASIFAMPSAKKNSMNANTIPNYVLATVKNAGQPIQLVNAFEKPVKQTYDKSIAEVSKEALLEYLKTLKDVWGVEHTCEISIPENNIKTFLDEIISYV